MGRGNGTNRMGVVYLFEKEAVILGNFGVIFNNQKNGRTGRHTLTCIDLESDSIQHKVLVST
jgi:hypothetical protein